MIEVVKEMDLIYDTWGQGRENAMEYERWGILEEVENIISEWVYGSNPTDCTINDILAYEIDTIAEALGYEDYQDLYNKMEGIEEEEEE